MDCQSCGASIPEVDASTCPNCGAPIPGRRGLGAPGPTWFDPEPVVEDDQGRMFPRAVPDSGADDRGSDEPGWASEAEEAAAEEFDQAAPERHPSAGHGGMQSDRNYYRLTADFGGKVGEFWVQASTDGVARKILREYAKDEGWVLRPAAGQPPFPDRSKDMGRYYAAKDAAITVEQISHDVPRDFIHRENSKKRPTRVRL